MVSNACADSHSLDMLPQRFQEKILVDPQSGCWVWQGSRSAQGYGRVAMNGRARFAHRVVYELLIGPIPSGLQLDHVKARGCTSRACCRPEHLEPVTARVNNLRADGTPGLNARKTHCVRGHEFTPENTYVRPSGMRNCLTCKRAYERALKRPSGGARRSLARKLAASLEVPCQL